MNKMTAKEVIRLYNNGERDFRRLDLRGQSFKGQDLSGADFSEADIRSTNFAKVNLSQANFTGATAGIQKHWWLVQQLLAVVMGLLSGILSGFSGGLIAYLFTQENIKAGYWLAGLTSILCVLFIIISLALQGFTDKAFPSILLAVAVGVGVGVGVGVAIAGSVAIGVGVAVAVGVGVGVAVAAAAAVGVAVGVTAAAAAAVGVGVGVAVAAAVGVAGPVDVGVGVGVAGAILLFSIYIAWQTRQGNEKFHLLRIWSNDFAAIGGTSFTEADLSGATFDRALLKSTNFSKANLTQVSWKDARKLDFARWGDSILANNKLRKLLVSHNGAGEDYRDLDLCGVNLAAANLSNANFKQANLNCAILRHANLKNANLTETRWGASQFLFSEQSISCQTSATIGVRQLRFLYSDGILKGGMLPTRCLDTDFTSVDLTGACIEGWNIDHSTKLDNVECHYVFLLEEPNKYGSQERRPSSGDFALGEFTKLFQEVLSTVDLIFRDGVDWKAFITAFQQVQVENEDTPLQIQRIENKGDGVFVVRVSLPPDADKEKIHSEFKHQYDIKLAALEAKYRAELQAKDSEIIDLHRERYTDMKVIANSLANQQINVQAISESKSMSNGDDSSRKIEFGHNTKIVGSTLNLGSISGSVTNAINQLPDSGEAQESNIKGLLTQLQQAIETDIDLPEPAKADLLEEVKNLATAGQTEEPAQKDTLTRKAKKMFDGTLKNLPDTAKIAEASSKLLPLILKVLGVSV